MRKLILIAFSVSSFFAFPRLATAACSWHLVPSPNGSKYPNYSSSIAAVSASNVWAVGWYSVDGYIKTSSLTEHWNGSRWSIVPSPNGTLNSVAALSASDLWAVGSYSDGANGRTLTEHWNGSRWSAVPNPSIDGNLNSVAAVSASNVWAVGRYVHVFLGTTGPNVD